MERAHSLSFTEVKNLLVDPGIIEVMQGDNSYPADDHVGPSYQNVVLLLTDICSTVDYFSLENFLLGLRNPPEMLKVRFLFFKTKYSVAMQFKRPEQVGLPHAPGQELLRGVRQPSGQFPEDLRCHLLPALGKSKF